MPNYQATFFIEGVNQAEFGASASLGWTETWYGSYPGTVDAALLSSDISNYVKKRREALAQEYRISFVRVNDVDNPHLFKVLTLQSAGGAAKGAGTQYTPAQAALLVDIARLARDTVHNEPTHHRKFLLRGLPDGIISANVIKPDASAYTAVRAFLNFIGNHETGAAVKGPGANQATWLGARFHDPVFGSAVVTGITVDLNDPRNIRVTPDAPVFGSGRLQITGTPYRQFNRTWTLIDKVVVGGVTTMVLGQAKTAIPGLLTYAGPGRAKWRRVQYQYGLYDQYTVIGPRIRKTGSVFRQPRGRSSAQSA